MKFYALWYRWGDKSIPELLATSNEISKLEAICPVQFVVCNDPNSPNLKRKNDKVFPSYTIVEVPFVN